MTAQSASRVGSLVSSIKGAASKCSQIAGDTIIAAMFLVTVAMVVVPLAHHIWNYWNAFAAAWVPAPTTPQKATVKRASP